MPTIPETYAAPHLRLGLLLFDLPGTDVTYLPMKGHEMGIPDFAGGDADLCVATIVFPDGRPSVQGYKVCPARMTVDEWNILCTKALGRALKKAGYPDDTKDLKTLVLWRQRQAEIGAIQSGTAQLQLAPAPIEKAIEASGKTEATVSHDDDEAPDTETAADGIEDAVIVDEEDDMIADEDAITYLRQRLSALAPEKAKEVTAWARKQSIRVTQPDLTHGQIEKVLGFIENIMGVAADGHGSEDAAMIAELIKGLDETEQTVFRKFCKDQSIDPIVAANTPGQLSVDDQQALLGWLEVSAQ